MARVLRIEGRGAGMYASGLWDLATDYFDRDDKHPAPWKDSRLEALVTQTYSCEEIQEMRSIGVYPVRQWLRDHPETLFGFESVDQLRRWIYKDYWIESMAEFGGELVTYELKPGAFCFVGYTQVMFHGFAAIEVKREPISVLLEMNHATTD